MNRFYFLTFLSFISLNLKANLVDTFLFRGVVVDKESKEQLLNVKVELSDSCDNKVDVDYTDMYGRFFFNIQSNCKSYKIVVSKSQEGCSPKYLPSDRIYILSEMKNSVTVELRPLENELMNPVLIFSENSFLFYYSWDTLTVHNLIALQSGFDTLELNDYVRYLNCDHSCNILIESYYTKTEGAKYNDLFAIMRANYFSSYLVSKGINMNRIQLSIKSASEFKGKDYLGRPVPEKCRMVIRFNARQ